MRFPPTDFRHGSPKNAAILTASVPLTLAHLDGYHICE